MECSKNDTGNPNDYPLKSQGSVSTGLPQVAACEVASSFRRECSGSDSYQGKKTRKLVAVGGQLPEPGSEPGSNPAHYVKPPTQIKEAPKHSEQALACAANHGQTLEGRDMPFEVDVTSHHSREKLKNVSPQRSDDKEEIAAEVMLRVEKEPLKVQMYTDALNNLISLKQSQLSRIYDDAYAENIARVLGYGSPSYHMACNMVRGITLHREFCCGGFQKDRFIAVLSTIFKFSGKKYFPQNIIGIGSGHAFLEKSFSLMGLSVNCYDKKPDEERYCFLSVKKAEFPADINRCLPEDCRDVMLVAGYPQGYLGPVLQEFLNRGGKRLCITVESSVYSEMHLGLETDENVLEEALKKIHEKEDDSFKVRLADSQPVALATFIMFCNFPNEIKHTLADNPVLKDLVSNIDFFDEAEDISDTSESENLSIDLDSE